MKQWWFVILWMIAFPLQADNIFVETVSFDSKGGWVVDNQYIGQMGSPYLLAHGLGVPVENALTMIQVKKTGKYRVWVRTKDWVKQWSQSGSPGRFELLLNGKALKTTFGTEKA